jgi:UDP-N-acetyl-alpha-D-quinovosamine dehydrogenase
MAGDGGDPEVAMKEGMVVVTGAAGFVGRGLCDHFGQTGRRFRAIVRQGDSGATLPAQRHRVADLATTPDAELDALLCGATAVVHLAGRAHVMRETAADPMAAFRTANALVTSRLARAAVRAGVRMFVFASTVKVNGEVSAPGRPFLPGDPPAPRDPYARSKFEAEHGLAGICAGTELVPVILRLPLVYGPGVGGNFLALLDAIARGSALPFGAIRNRRSLLHVGNLSEAIASALDGGTRPGGVHFVADAESVSVPDLAREIAAALGVPARLWPIPVPILRLCGRLAGRGAIVDRLVNSLEVDTASFTAATGWRPRHTLAEGLAATARWWRTRHAM